MQVADWEEIEAEAYWKERREEEKGGPKEEEAQYPVAVSRLAFSSLRLIS